MTYLLSEKLFPTKQGRMDRIINDVIEVLDDYDFIN